MNIGRINTKDGFVTVGIDHGSGGKRIWIAVSDTKIEESALVTLDNDAAEQLAIQIIEAVRKGKANG